MRMFKKVLAGFVAAAMVATMAGCGSSNSSTKDSGSDKAAAEATTEAAAPAKVLNTNAANKLIYCITPSTSNPYFGTVQTACKEEGEKGDYAELLGLESDTNCQVRSNAFHRVLDQTDMKMVAQQSANWDQTEGQSKAETILQQYPDITAIVCGNDTMACGAAAAVAAANLDHDVYIIGVDGSNDMRDNIKDGKALATALQQIDKITRNAVTQANDYLTNGTTGLEEKQLVDCVVITKDNADKLDNFVFAE